MSDFKHEFDTTTAKTRLAVMIEMDYLEDSSRGYSEMVTLTRLHDRVHQGEHLSNDDLTTVVALSQKLGITETKMVQVVAGASRSFGSVVLSRPLGGYYTKISLPYLVYHFDTLQTVWDENPIEFCEIATIPARGGSLDSHRISRCVGVSLNFPATGFSGIMDMLVKTTWECQILELRSPVIRDLDCLYLHRRLQGKWPNLKKIVKGK